MPTETKENLTIAEAVEKAVQNTGNDSEEIENESLENSEEAIEGSETSEETEEEQETLLELDPEDVELILSLKDSKKRDSVIRDLYKEIDKTVKEIPKTNLPETPKDVRKDAKQLAKELFGDQYELLPDKFVDFVEQVVAEKLTPIVSTLQQTTLASAQREVDTVFETLAASEEYSDIESLSDEMNSLISQVQIGEKQSLEDYVKLLYRVAKAQKSATKPETPGKKKVQIKVMRGAALPRATGKTAPTVSSSQAKLSVKEAIEKAAKDLKIQL